MSFASLGLAEPILQGVRAAGYDTPTDIQASAIPKILAGAELIGLGETGSGKTAAFGLPMLHRLCGGEPGLRGIIVVPTRELCVQVAENLRTYAKFAGLHVCTAFGGVDLSIQESAFKRGLDVLVACPGRLIDHLERRNITLEKVQMVVLDEADRMLDMGFMPQIRRIFVRLPQERQNLLFSATMPNEVEALVNDFLPNAERVQIGSRSQSAATISHRFAAVNAVDKQSALERLLQREPGRVLIFVNKKIGCERLGNALKRAGLPADAIHGDKGAEARHSCLQAFARGKTRFLVATDVAARGIDVDDIELVVNFDFPLQLEDYVHRTGRTGRAGKTGRALSLVAPMEKRLYSAVVAHLQGKEVPDMPKAPGRGYGMPKRREGGGRERGRGKRSGGGGRGRRGVATAAG
ncbi:MAG TPA: DEAD/DEAH box helicase [Planctomycetota bacterium]|nr:DEAD/DEAH box helicase [Planctomycetota bacterium]